MKYSNLNGIRDFIGQIANRLYKFLICFVFFVDVYSSVEKFWDIADMLLV